MLNLLARLIAFLVVAPMIPVVILSQECLILCGKLRKRLQRPPNRLPGAFTLLEVLVATVMFAVVVGALYSVFHGALELRERSARTSNIQVSRQYTIARIKRDLSNAMPPSGILAGPLLGENEESGQSSSGRIELYTASGIPSDLYPWGDIRKVEYSLETLSKSELELDSGEIGGKILVRKISNNLLATVEETPEEEYLLKGIESTRFTFYDGEQWVESWDSTVEDDALPSAVEIRIVFVQSTQDEQNNPPLELVVPIVTQSPPDEEESEGQEGKEGGSQEGGGGGASEERSSPPQQDDTSGGGTRQGQQS